MNTAPVNDKMRAFGFEIAEIDGQDLDAMDAAFAAFHANRGSGKPFAILMTTVKGKGVSFMENNVGWHGKAPNDEEYAVAMQELRAQLSELKG